MGLHARAEQQLLLQPKLLQSIEVLQIPAQDLEAYLAEAAETNEALVVEPRTGEASSGPVDWDATDRHSEMLNNQPDRDRGLAESIGEQLSLLDVDEEALAWVRFLITCLDENGYLSAGDEELLALAGQQGMEDDPRALGLAIGRLQKLEPRGIGGRDMVEALLLQLDEDTPDYPLLCRLLEEFLNDVASNRLPAVARALGIDLDELGLLLGQLRYLEPRPGAELVAKGQPGIRPDVVVDRDEDGNWQVRVEWGALPAVSIDTDIANLASTKDTPKEVKGWARDKVERARWIVDAVAQRGETLQRVAQEVFRRQAAFLESGPGNLLPLSMTELADTLDVHLSTISRTVSGKYVQCPWGILPLRYFIQKATGSDGAPARDDLSTIVRSIFDAEDPTEPLSDDDVALELGRRGHKVARRTVAKFRGQLGILSSYKRRKFTS